MLTNNLMLIVEARSHCVARTQRQCFTTRIPQSADSNSISSWKGRIQIEIIDVTQVVCDLQ